MVNANNKFEVQFQYPTNPTGLISVLVTFDLSVALRSIAASGFLKLLQDSRGGLLSLPDSFGFILLLLSP